MNQSHLRNIRIILSVFFFLPITYVLIDFYGAVPPSLKKIILFLQFTPSLLNFITVLSWSAIGFAVVILLTFLFGRVYCSSICPLGVFQDIVNFISKSIKKRKKKFEYINANLWLPYSLLALTIILFIFGINTAVSFLDPYSIYGRFSGSFLLPLLAYGNNGVSLFFELFNNFSVYPYDIQPFNVIPFLITLTFFVLVVYMSFKFGRLYCNTVCPVGTLLGILSKFALLKIRIKEEECLGCGACARDCRSGCIDSKNKTVDHSRCVACFDCIPSCPTEGINYGLPVKKKSGSNQVNDNSKRDFLTKTSIYLLSLSAFGSQVQKEIVITKPSTIPVMRKSAVSPPGSESVERFTSKCTACHLCVTACPTQVLQPSFLEYGFTGMLQPRLDNSAGYCNFDCVLCSEVCPTGAILPMIADKKRLSQIGIAKFIKDNCIVNTQKTACGACSEHCPTKAVHMIPFEKGLVIPEVREDYCIGCGACEFACPTKPYKSIYVEGNKVHKIAKKNVEEKKLEKVDLEEDFPF